MRRAWVVLVVAMATGCGGKAMCDLGTTSAGTLEGTINNDPWTADGLQWQRVGSGLSITSPQNGGHAIYLTALRDVEGEMVDGLIEQKSYPILVYWDDPDNGVGRFDHSTGNSMLAQPGGELIIDRIKGGVAQGCFAFDANDPNSGEAFDIEASFQAELGTGF